MTLAAKLIAGLALSTEGAKLRAGHGKRWLDIDPSFNVRNLDRWRQYESSSYVALFKGDGSADYILELDTALIVCDAGKFTWHLTRPKNPKTLRALTSTLGGPRPTSAAYRERVRAARIERGQPGRAVANGYLLVSGASFAAMLGSLQELLAAVVAAHGGKWPTYRHASSKPLPELDPILADFEKRLRASMHDSAAARRERLRRAPKKPVKTTATTTVFLRNADVVAEVLERANGRCEKCRCRAPFKRRKDGSPYLEVHHLKQLAKGGDDTVENAIALCPNCHRCWHFG